MNPDDEDEGPDLDSVADCEEKTVDSRGWGHEREQMEEIRAWLKSKEKAATEAHRNHA